MKRPVVINVDAELAAVVLGWFYTFAGGFVLGFAVAWIVGLLR